MDFPDLLQKFLHLDDTLEKIFLAYGALTYAILFLVVFCETGLVVCPFLPGDSLLFAAGTFTAVTLEAGIRQQPSLELHWVFLVFTAAAVCGDSLNYWIGRGVGPKVFKKDHLRFINRKNLEKAHMFYENHGGKTVAIGRFLPIIRTFVPFVAGIAKMSYVRFVVYSIVGTLCWVSTFVLTGHYFGQMIKDKLGDKGFSYIVMGIIVISLLPALITFIRNKMSSRKPEPEAIAEGDRKS